MWYCLLQEHTTLLEWRYLSIPKFWEVHSQNVHHNRFAFSRMITTLQCLYRQWQNIILSETELASQRWVCSTSQRFQGFKRHCFALQDAGFYYNNIITINQMSQEAWWIPMEESQGTLMPSGNTLVATNYCFSTLPKMVQVIHYLWAHI